MADTMELVDDLIAAMPVVRRAVQDLDVENLKLEANGPWVQVTAWVHLEGARKWAVWTETGALFPVCDDGTVAEDPVP